MNSLSRAVTLTAAVSLGGLWAAGSAHASPIIVNGSFETGLVGWTVASQIGSDGGFQLQTGSGSPVNGFSVPAPPDGVNAVMSDALGPGSHVLYQDFTASGGPASVAFSLFVANDYSAPDFYVPAALETLDFATPALNQQARVDIMLASADPFSIASGDILQSLFVTLPGDPLVSGYTHVVVDVSALLLAHAGETLRLRFAEVDNVAPFNLGVDAVSIDPADPVPEPASLLLLGTGLAAFVARRRR